MNLLVMWPAVLSEQLLLSTRHGRDMCENVLQTMFDCDVGVGLVGGVRLSEWTITNHGQQQFLRPGRYCLHFHSHTYTGACISW